MLFVPQSLLFEKLGLLIFLGLHVCVKMFALVFHYMQVGGNHIRVDRACPPRKKLKGEHTPLYDNKRTVFVGNLPFDVKVCFLQWLFVRGIWAQHCCCLYSLLNITRYSSLQDEELYRVFSRMSNLESNIEAVRVIRDPHLNIGKGIAYVLFKTRVRSFSQQDH